MSDLDLQVKGIKELEEKMGHVLEPAKTMISDLARYIQAEADKFAKPHPADKGTLGKTVKMTLGPGPIPLWAEVWTKSGIAPTVEVGRLGGKPPPIKRIETWARAHGYLGANESGYDIWFQIKQKGTKGIYFMKQAEEAGREKAGDMLVKLARTIEGHWSKGG
jgi:hypothetical protein